MEITSIERSKKNRDKLLVYIDGKYSFSISEEDYISLNLYEKKEVTGEELDFIKNTMVFKSAKSTAVKYMSLKLRSEKEVCSKLEAEGFDRGTIASVIEELKSMGYINDKIYVQKYLYDRSKLKPKAKRLLKLELVAKGIEDEIIDEVLAEWEIDDYNVAESLVRKKFGKYDLRDEKIIKKVYSFLMHRGFKNEIIREIISKYGDISLDNM